MTDTSLKRQLKVLTIPVFIEMALAGESILTAFTDNEEIIKMGVWVLFVDIFLEVGRTSNIFAGSTLRATGDVVYPFVVGVILVRRWRSGKWRKNAFFLCNPLGLLQGMNGSRRNVLHLEAWEEAAEV